MQFVELNDRQRKQILAAVGSEGCFGVKSVFCEVNLNILTALYDPETERYLTRHYYVASVVTQGPPEEGYLLLQGDKVHFVSEDDAEAQEMIEIYDNECYAREQLEKQLMNQYQLKDADGDPLRTKADYLQWYLQANPDAAG